MSCKRGIEHNHEHVHSENCGHKRVQHENHIGYLHDGCLHCQHEGHMDEHKIEHSKVECTNGHSCVSHDHAHVHGDNCGHSKVPHGDHVCYLVDGHLHSYHNGHCDHHGELKVVCNVHSNHSHVHSSECGHVQIIHDGHVGYLHNGHLHCPHDKIHIDEHVIEVSSANPTGCQGKSDQCSKSSHVHSATCGHPVVPHGDHFDYIVNGQLHHAHEGHCDHHGSITVVHPVHERHNHLHSKTCGHTQIIHDGHVDYLHDGHLHHMKQDGKCEDHIISESNYNKSECTPSHKCDSHTSSHVHGVGCGHEMVSHGDHFDYLVNGHLHHPHGSHCDHHGPIQIAV
jgi:hypothetical protein